MEIQLKELLDQIKKDGVEVAEAEAKAIIDNAKSEAEKIIFDAQKEADAIISNAKKENEKIVKSSEEAIRQAGRNLLISFRESVTRELENLLSENVLSVYSSDAFAGLVIKAVENWAAKPDADDLSVILNENDLKMLEETIISGIKEKISGGVTLRASDSFDGGFRIATENGKVYYDYSKDAVVDMLSNYLNPRITALLKEAE